MAEATFLSGRVLKHSLPVFDAPTGPDAPILKRLLLPQGELTLFHDDAEAIHYIAFIELREGGVRGNHYHKIKKEYVYVIGGEALLLVEDIASKARDSLSLGAGEIAIIPVTVAHSLRTVTAGQAVEFSPARYDPSDTYRYPLSVRS